MLESALVLLAFLAIIIGAMDFAQFMYYHQSLAARLTAGADWAARHEFNETSIKNFVMYNNPAPPANARPIIARMQASQISARLLNADTAEARVELSISNFPYTVLSPWISGTYVARTLTARMPHEPSLP